MLLAVAEVWVGTAGAVGTVSPVTVGLSVEAVATLYASMA